MPKLSIIIPTYNSEATLGRALESIVNQTFTDWEVLIMDGRSKDRTLEVAAQFNDDRIRVYSEQDKGVYDAMNKGIAKAKGEWTYFLGSDDSLFDGSVLSSLMSGDYDAFDVVYGDVNAPQLLDRNRGEWQYDDIEYNRCHQAIFYKRNLFSQLGLYNLKYKAFADHDFNLRWFTAKQILSKYVPIVVANFSMGGLSASGDMAFERDMYKIILRSAYSKISSSQRITYLKRVKNNSSSLFGKVLLSLFININRVERRILG